MKTVVITGSARGFGLEMLKLFRKENFNTVICDVNEEAIKGAKENLKKINGKGKVLAYQTDITKEEEVNNLISEVKKETKEILEECILYAYLEMQNMMMTKYFDKIVTLLTSIEEVDFLVDALEKIIKEKF